MDSVGRHTDSKNNTFGFTAAIAGTEDGEDPCTGEASSSRKIGCQGAHRNVQSFVFCT